MTRSHHKSRWQPPSSLLCRPSSKLMPKSKKLSGSLSKDGFFWQIDVVSKTHLDLNVCWNSWLINASELDKWIWVYLTALQYHDQNTPKKKNTMCRKLVIPKTTNELRCFRLFARWTEAFSRRSVPNLDSRVGRGVQPKESPEFSERLQILGCLLVGNG